MSIFCKHEWQESERFVYPGHDLNNGFEGKMSLHAFKEILEALKPKTTILYKCKLCGKPKYIEVIGTTE